MFFHIHILHTPKNVVFIFLFYFDHNESNIIYSQQYKFILQYNIYRLCVICCTHSQYYMVLIKKNKWNNSPSNTIIKKKWLTMPHNHDFQCEIKFVDFYIWLWINYWFYHNHILINSMRIWTQTNALISYEWFQWSSLSYYVLKKFRNRMKTTATKKKKK